VADNPACVLFNAQRFLGSENKVRSRYLRDKIVSVSCPGISAAGVNGREE
jgi:hypothetical protein